LGFFIGHGLRFVISYISRFVMLALCYTFHAIR